MRSFLASCIILLLLSVALPHGVSKLFVNAASQQLPPASSLRTPLESNAQTALAGLTNTTNSTGVVPTQSPTPAAPTSKPTNAPTRKYESPEDKEDEEEEKREHSVGRVFLWVAVAFAVIGVLLYFRDVIFFFFSSAWTNTQRFGCKGCLHSFFPCFFGRLGLGGSEPLDQIIFETEDPNEPLMS